MDKIEMTLNDYKTMLAYIQALESINRPDPIVGQITSRIHEQVQP